MVTIQMGSSTDEDIYREIVDILDQGGNAALATIISKEGTSPREVGSKLLLREDNTFTGSVGGGAVEASVLKAARESMVRGEPRLARFGEEESDASCCGGVLDIYIEPILGSPVLFICGAGHVAQYVAQVGHMAGFKVIVADDREELANRELFPDAEEIMVGPLPQILHGLVLGSSSYIVIVRGHDQDGPILSWAARTPARYIGMIGSKNKVKGILSDLEAEGIQSERLKLIKAPIGLDIGAETPQEIAVAVMAEIIKARRGKD